MNAGMSQCPTPRLCYILFVEPGCVIRMSRACRGLPNSQDGGKDGLVAEACRAEAGRKKTGLVSIPISEKDARGLLHTCTFDSQPHIYICMYTNIYDFSADDIETSEAPIVQTSWPPRFSRHRRHTREHLACRADGRRGPGRFG